MRFLRASMSQHLGNAFKGYAAEEIRFLRDGFPPIVGRKQVIEISHVSGMSNVKHWLREHGYDADNEDLCKRVFELAKTTNHTLSEAELRQCCEAV